MRHGYFLPLQNKLCGDMEFANESKELYDSLGLSYEFAGRFDGASIFQRESGEIVKRVCLQDFFDSQLKVLVRDLP
jgi:hypothetical protein